MSLTVEDAVSQEGETPTDLAQEIRRLMVRAYPGPPKKTTEIVNRDAILEALDDQELIIHIQAQKPTSLDSEVRLAQHMEVVLHLPDSKYSRPVPTVVREPEGLKADEEAKEQMINQGLMLSALKDLVQQIATMNGRFQAAQQGRLTARNGWNHVLRLWPRGPFQAKLPEHQGL